MSEYYTYYIESNIVCFIIFAIMLSRDITRIDRQEKQIKYDRVLAAFMLYFLSDSLWAAITAEFLPKTVFSSVAVHFTNYVLMVAITYMWLDYVMAVEQIPNRNRRLNRFAVIFPFIVSTIALIITYCAAPQVLLDENLNSQPAYSIFLTAGPDVYVVAVLFYALRKASHEENPRDRRRHLYIGFFPLLLVAGGLMELIVLPDLPAFCFSCTILMVIFYIQSMEAQISIDPLTGLNNRGQLHRYIAQRSSLHMENLRTFVVMIDVNDFKAINDTYGHDEGDSALILISNALRNAVRNHNMPTFLGRYGGDEFILIAHTAAESELQKLTGEMRDRIVSECRAEEKPYELSIGIGYDELMTEADTFQRCLQRADHKLYLDKDYVKLHNKTTVFR